MNDFDTIVDFEDEAIEPAGIPAGFTVIEPGNGSIRSAQAQLDEMDAALAVRISENPAAVAKELIQRLGITRDAKRPEGVSWAQAVAAAERGIDDSFRGQAAPVVNHIRSAIRHARRQLQSEVVDLVTLAANGPLASAAAWFSDVDAELDQAIPGLSYFLGDGQAYATYVQTLRGVRSKVAADVKQKFSNVVDANVPGPERFHSVSNFEDNLRRFFGYQNLDALIPDVMGRIRTRSNEILDEDALAIAQDALNEGIGATAVQNVVDHIHSAADAKFLLRLAAAPIPEPLTREERDELIKADRAEKAKAKAIAERRARQAAAKAKHTPAKGKRPRTHRARNAA